VLQLQATCCIQVSAAVNAVANGSQSLCLVENFGWSCSSFMLMDKVSAAKHVDHASLIALMSQP